MVYGMSGLAVRHIAAGLLLLAFLVSNSAAFLLFVKRSETGDYANYEPLGRVYQTLGKAKRSPNGLVMSVPESEDVCTSTILHNHRPRFGHSGNGSRVEIQQDDDVQFIATYIECDSSRRVECHGIDKKMFSSECVTSFENRFASIRPLGSDGPFELGLIKVPIMCQCRLRRFMPV